MADVVKLWILGSAACVVAGWVLSALHQLNGPGYLAFFALVGVAFAFWRRRHPLTRTLGSETGGCRRWMGKLRRRFRRPLPRGLRGRSRFGIAGWRSLCADQL